MGYVTGHTGERRDAGSRRAPTVAWGAVVVLLTGGLVLAALTGRPWIFAALIGLVLLGGIGLASGVLERRRPGVRARGPVPLRGTATPALRAAVEARLERIDRLEHRRIDLGEPWPSVIVGPTGVAVVTPARVAHGPVRHRLAAVVAEVEQRLVGSAAQVLPVRGLLVLERADADVRAPAVGPIRRVTVDDLLDTMGQGRLAPMSAVAAAHARLAGELAPDLTAAAS